MGFTKKEVITLLIGAGLTALGWLTIGKVVGISVIILVVITILGIHFLEGKSKADIFLYAVAALLLFPSIVFSISGTPLMSIVFPPKQLTADTLESQLKEWVSQSGFGTSDVSMPDLDADFEFSFPFPSDLHSIGVKRLTANGGHFLQIWTDTQLKEDRIRAIEKLSPERQRRLDDDLKVQLSKLNLDYKPNQQLGHEWVIQKSVRIQDGMDVEFLETTQRVHRAALALEQTVDRELNTTEVATGR